MSSQWLSVKLKYLYLSFVAVLFGVSNPALADSKEVALKAALIYKMGQYVTWTNPPKILNYCFVGETSKTVGKVLEDRLSKLQGGNSQIVYHSKIDDIERYECQVIYMTNAKSKHKEKVDDLSKFSLTIGENTSALSHGFITVLEIKSRKPQLYASRGNLKQAKFKVSSRLLKSSKLVD